MTYEAKQWYKGGAFAIMKRGENVTLRCIWFSSFNEAIQAIFRWKNEQSIKE